MGVTCDELGQFSAGHPREGGDLPAQSRAQNPPSPEESYWVYILSNCHNNVLYIGSTNHATRRQAEHIRKNKQGFTAKYNVEKLVYMEEHVSRAEALKREKQLKKWNREWKENLVSEANPQWHDLSSLEV